jgi:hypothetical protein
MDSTSEQTESTETNLVNEKVKNKLREYQELKCLYNLSNAALLFKRNISLICQERIEKNININPKTNNYYSGKNTSMNVFNLKNVMKDIFGEYISKHNIDIDKEVKKMELEREEKRKLGKKYGSIMQKKFMAIKAIQDQTENNVKVGDKRRNRKNYNYYVVQEKKKSKEKNNKPVNNVVISNCKRKSALEKKTKNENENKKEEEKTNNLIIINSRDKNKPKIIKKEKEEKKDEKNEEASDKNKKIDDTQKNKEQNNKINNNTFINSVKNDLKNKDNKNTISDNISGLREPKTLLNNQIVKTTPKKKRNEPEIKKQKSYTYKRHGRNEITKNKEERSVNRYLNYRSRSKSNNKSGKKEKKIETLKKSSSAKKMKTRRRGRHHRHHHFQHFKKPKRVINISKLDSFSIIQFN